MSLLSSTTYHDVKDSEVLRLMAMEVYRRCVKRRNMGQITCFTQVLVLSCLLLQCHGFSGVGVVVAPVGRASPLTPSTTTMTTTTTFFSSSPTSFRYEPGPRWRHMATAAATAAAAAAAAARTRSSRRRGRVVPSASLLPTVGEGEEWTCFNRNPVRTNIPGLVGHSNDHHYRRRDQGQRVRRCNKNGTSRLRRRPCLLYSPASPTSLSAVSGGSTSSQESSSPSPRGEVDARGDEEAEEAGEGLAAAGEGRPLGAARRLNKSKKKKKNKKGVDDREKSLLGKAGDAVKVAFNGFMAASTVVSLALAAEAFWQLHGAPLTLSNVVPTVTKLLPLTGIGVFGAAQLVGVVARVVRVIVTLPIMLSGTWVILQNAPKLLPRGSDLTGAGSIAALLATPEVLEAVAVVALLGGTAVWAINFTAGAVGALIGGEKDAADEDEEDWEDELG